MAKGKSTDQIWGLYSIFNLIITYLEIGSALFNKKRRAIHDFIGGTVIVKYKISSVAAAVIASLIAVIVYGLYLRIHSAM